MLHSKATAALMKLKEIDRKYKMKSTEELAKHRPSLSDISSVDSVAELTTSIVAPPGSGDSPNTIARLRLNIRMPEAHMERAEIFRNVAKVDGIEPVELVTVFDKSEKNSPRSSKKSTNLDEVVKERTVGPAGEGNDSVFHHLKNSSSSSSSFHQDSSIKEEHTANTGTSISEEVLEMVPTTPRSSSPIPGHKVASPGDKISLKSVRSIIVSEERAQSLPDEDPSTLVASNTYSDDFVKTISQVVSLAEDLPSSENAEKSTVEHLTVSVAEVQESRARILVSLPSNHYQRQRLLVAGAADSGTKETIELVSRKIMSSVPSECDIGLDPVLNHYVKTMERRASGNENSEEAADSPVRFLSRSSQAASARSSKTRRRKVRRRAITSRDSKAPMSQEFSSSFEYKTDSTIVRTSESQNPSESQKTQELEKSRRRNDATQVSCSLAKEIPKTITRRKIVTKVKTESAKNRTRAEAPSTVEPAPSQSNDYNETQKSIPTTQPVPVRMMVGLAPLGDDAHKLRISKMQKERSKKMKNEENVRCKHSPKHGGLDQRKNRTRKKSGSFKEEPDRLGRMGMTELHPKREERGQLRARVRGYIQQMMDERERLLIPDGFGVPVDKHVYCNRGTSRLRQSESPRRRYLFKPLDLPNVAAFKRPDSGERIAADLNHNEEYKNLYTIRDRVFDIRHWLKQQFILYKNYSNLASTINAKYVPVTIKETKKMIHDMQRYCNSSDRCSNCHQLK